MLDISALKNRLIDLASQKKCLPYQQLVSEFNILPPNSIRQLTDVLELITSEDVLIGRPILTSVVIQKGKAAIPRDGYFMQLQTLNVYNGSTSGPEAAMWHANHLEEVFRFYAK